MRGARVHITGEALKRLKKREGRAEIWDSELLGFGARKYESGTVRYLLRRTGEDGKRRLVQLESSTLAAARKEAAGLLSGALDRTPKTSVADLLRVPKRKHGQPWPDDPSLYGEYLQKHETRKQRRPAWKDRDTLRRAGALVERWGKRPLASIMPDDVNALVDDYAKRGSPIEGNRQRALVSAVWNWARARRLIPNLANPVQGSRRNKERPRQRVLADDEHGRLLAAAREYGDPYAYAALLLALTVGMRKSWILGLGWDHVELDRETMTGVVRIDTLKGREEGDGQEIHIEGLAVEVLLDLPRSLGSPWVFPSPRNPHKHREDIRRPWDKIREMAGVSKDKLRVTLHDLRRTTGTDVAALADPKVASELLGHKDQAVTLRHYVRHGDDKQRAAVKARGERVRKLADGGGEP